LLLEFDGHSSHRVERVTASGGEVGRLNTGGGTAVRLLALKFI